MKKSIFLGLILIQISFALAIQPFGANLTVESSTRATPDSPQSVEAIAGNVTELNIEGFSTTQSWQGYFGNVSGTIMLADSSDSVMYNWSLASPQGEIYASTNDSVSWSDIQCLNFTSDGTYASESGNGGTTSQHGTNLTQLETLFGIEFDDVDGVNETFNLIGPGTHDLFYTNNLEFSEGECRNTRIFDSSGSGVNDNFEEVLMYDPVTRSIIFTSIIDENINGFDGTTHDFEMLVLEDGHETDVDTTTYYFYVELE